MDSPYAPTSYHSKLGRLILRLKLTNMVQANMNRFLTRRKDKALDDNASSGKKPKRGKKGQPEPEPQLNLATALPSTDDFRTSLIMPSLSTRFSMLREQDDPNSKLGKASDDSVLQPKRQSRLHEFGFIPGGLSDIAEVSSLNGSIRPPFAAERQDSFGSQRSEESSGSVMTRARPGEGNVLFGGRQKVYKISNTASSKSLGGRMLYDDDLNMSAFQKLRLEEKERQREQEMGAEDAQQSEPSSPVTDAYSPSVSAHHQRRETSSSTNSGNPNARTSTAATSIASQGANSVPASSPALPSSAMPTSPPEVNRTGTKARRLYDQALDQHMYDQQSSAINRLNSIQRTRAPTGRSTPPLLFSQTRSATNLSDRFNRGGSSSVKESQSGASSPITSRPHSPPLVSPLGSDKGDAQMLSSALQPNDRGKATAMGAFNKPKQAFSEQQYAERLKQLQQERDASAPKPAYSQKPSLRERAELGQQKRIDVGVNGDSSSNSSDEPREVLQQGQRSRSGSPHEKTEIPASLNERSKSEPSPAEPQATPSAFSMFQSALNQMRGATGRANVPSPKQPEPSPRTVQSHDSQEGGTFFASPGSSDDEDDEPSPAVARPSDSDRRPHNLPTATGPAPPILDHPALRSRSNSQADSFQTSGFRSRSQSRPATTRRDEASDSASTLQAEPANPEQKPDIDSPTLGPENGGLSGLIRQHLRNVSNVSSDYGEDNHIAMSPPPLNTTSSLALQTNSVRAPARHLASETNTTTDSSYSHSNPWDLDEMETYGEGESMSSTSPVESQKPKSQDQNATALLSSPQAITETINEWEKEMKKTHKREPSIEEREAFQRELASRQRAIQETLRKASENRSRNASPAPSGGNLKNALSMLRAKSSKEAFAMVGEKNPDASNKAMKMLGLGTNSANASSTSLAGSYTGDHWRSEDRFGQPRQKPNRVLQQSEQDAQRELENRQRSATNDTTREPTSKGRTPPGSSNGSTRDRSSSEVSSGRSRSRAPQYRDDLEQAMAEGGSRTAVYPPNASPSVPGYVANPTQPLDGRRQTRSRSNSRTNAASYFESKHLQPIQTHHSPSNGASPRLTPAANSPMHQFSPGLPVSPRPSPGAPSPGVNTFRSQASPVPPYSAHNTPPVSGASTPIAPAFQTGAAAIIPTNGTLRKKSINKADISDPIFLSTTSVIDTVSLPAGASLKNGNPPPLPPINPMRRRFGFGRTVTDDPAVHTPYGESTYTNSSDTLASKESKPRQRLRKTSSEGKSLHVKSQVQPETSPAMPSMPFGSRNGSPPRPINNTTVSQQNMDGAMF